MLRVRSRVALSQVSESELVIQSSRFRRILFGSIGTILLVSFFIGSSTPSEPMIGGTIFYFVITGVSLMVAAWNSITRLDRESDTVCFEKRIAGVLFRTRDLPLSSVSEIVLQSVRLLKESEQPQPGLLNTRYRGYISRRNTYFRLYIETASEKILIEDSSDVEDLDRVGETVATFAGVTFRRVEI